MWILLKDASFSIVAHRDKPNHLMVRSRYEGDIKRVFKCKELFTPDADYPYRATITRARVARVMSAELKSMTYDNYKDEAQKFIPKRMPVLHSIWRLLLDAGGPSRYKDHRRETYRPTLFDPQPPKTGSSGDCGACPFCSDCPAYCICDPTVMTCPDCNERRNIL